MSVDEMEDLLDELGLDVVSSTGYEVKAHCPAHKERTGKEDNNPSWFINAETGAHICFSCHFKGSLAYLIGYMKQYYDASGQVDPTKAKEWFKSTNRLSDLLDKALTEKPVKEQIKVDPAMLAAFIEPPTEALRSRGITRQAAKDLKILWSRRWDNWILPVYDGFTNQLLGWQEKGYHGRFFKNYPTGMQRSNSLFGYRNYSSGILLLVESPLDVARLRSVGFSGVASYGSFVSNNQLKLLKSADKLIIAMDNDDAGKESTDRVVKMLPKLNIDAWLFNYSQTDQKDVGGMSRDEIVFGIESASYFLSRI